MKTATKETKDFWGRLQYALKVEGFCMVIAILGAGLLSALAFVVKSGEPVAGAGLWLACWFTGTQLWKLWYITRKK